MVEQKSLAKLYADSQRPGYDFQKLTGEETSRLKRISKEILTESQADFKEVIALFPRTFDGLVISLDYRTKGQDKKHALIKITPEGFYEVNIEKRDPICGY